VYGHWYSVPSRLTREAIEARITEQTVELFHRGTRVASHLRSPLRGRHTTIAAHMPSSHRRYADWTPARLMREAVVIGPSTAALVEQILHAKPHPEQGFRACLGILRLVRAWGAERVEAACQRGIDIGARSYSSIASILRNNLDRAYRPQSVPDEPPVSTATSVTAATTIEEDNLLHHPTTDHLRELGLVGMARAGRDATSARQRRSRLRGSARPDGRPRTAGARHQVSAHSLALCRAARAGDAGRC
jgi:hypothetical protein